MAFGRSASVPGGLSINTTSANSFSGLGTSSANGGMFGNTQPKPGGGLFGAPASSVPQTGGLFGSTAATTAPSAGGLFGSTAPASGGLFGSTPATTQQSTGGLFGSAPATSQPAGGLFGSTPTPQAGGLFGSAQNTQTQPGGGAQQGQAQNTGGGLFGSTPAAGGGLFGGLNQQNQTQNKPAGAGLFGGLGATQNQQPQPTSSLFGQPQGQQQGQQQGQNTNRFGGTNSIGGGLSLGQSTNQQQQQQQSVPGVRIDMSNIRGTTRFSDLHEDLQKQITQIDTVIQQQIQLKNDCDAIMPSHDSQLNQIPNDVEFCRRKLIGVENGQDSDVQSIANASQLVKTDADHAKLSFKAIDNLKLPPQYHNAAIWSSKPTSDGSNTEGDTQDIVGFFSATADELKATLDKYQSHITEIEQHLRGVELASAQQINSLVAQRQGNTRSKADPVEDLSAVLREFEQSLLGVAGKVGGAREAVQSVQLDGFGAPTNGRSQLNGRRSGIY